MMVTRSVPRQADGERGRTYQWLRVLKSAGLDVHLLCVLRPGESGGDVESLRGVCRWAHIFEPVPAPPWQGVKAMLSPMSRVESDMNHPALKAKIAELAPSVGLGICVDAVFHGAMKPMWSAPVGHRGMYILDLGTPLSDRRVLEAKAIGGLRGWVLRAESVELRALEAEAARAADLVMVENPIDLQRLSQRCKTARAWTVADGVELRDVNSDRAYAELPDSVVFLGDFSIQAHQRSAVWLAKIVMPMVRKTRDQTVLRLCGAGLPECVRELGELPGVEVNDSLRGGRSLNVALMHSVAGVAPQKDARGTARPVTLAMALGRPVVATPTVAACLPGDVGMGVIRGMKAAEIAESLVRVLRSRPAGLQQAMRGRELVEMSATWAAQWGRVGALLVEIAGGVKAPEVAGDRPEPIRAGRARATARV